MSLRGALCGLLAAVLFGLSAPLAKLLLPSTPPLVLAGLLYLGGGLALTLVSLLRPGRGGEAKLRGTDAPTLVAIIVLGGIAGPVLMLVGLSRLSGTVGSLLLNLEAPATIVLATLVFREHLGRRELGAAGLILLGALVLGLGPGEVRADPLGIAALAAACLCWALDNNLTQRLSLRDPVQLVQAKALGAGACSLGVALASGMALPDPRPLGAALLLGAFSYGASIVLDTYALRLLGAAREAALFATAPFVGALAAVPILGESLGIPVLLAGGLMALGVGSLLRERHRHGHTHEPLEHDHLHEHDAHHAHHHAEPVIGPHAHLHRHAALTHDHPHVSDLHHRHAHR